MAGGLRIKWITRGWANQRSSATGCQCMQRGKRLIILESGVVERVMLITFVNIVDVMPSLRGLEQLFYDFYSGDPWGM